MRATPLLTAAIALSIAAPDAVAQDTKSKDKEKSPAPARAEVWYDDGDDRATRVFRATSSKPRAMIGVTTTSSGVRDTLGLLIASVTPGGPAEKAGIVEGNRIASVNGVNLRLSAADAGEPDMNGLTVRRLTRELGKVQPGAEVDLRIYADGNWKNVKLRTVSSDSLNASRTVRAVRASSEERPVLGIELNATGSRRDTLGVLISTVHEDGPAEKAGLVEGDRVVSINGTDLRVRRDDMGDDYVSSAMVSRFQRVMRSVKPGDRVELRVYSGGQTKNVPVTAGRAADVYKEQRNFRRSMSIDLDGARGFTPRALIAPMPAMPPMPPRMRIHSMGLDGLDAVDHLDHLDLNLDALRDMRIDVEVESLMDTASETVEAAHDAIERVQDIGIDLDFDGVAGTTDADAATNEELERAREEARDAKEESRRLREQLINVERGLERSQSRSASNVPSLLASPTLRAISLTRAPAAKPSSSTFRIAGLTLARVTPDLAEYLGKGSRDGYLVLESAGNWSAVHAGDVLLAVDGHCVLDGSIDIASAASVREVTVLRKGKRTTVQLLDA